MSMSVIFLLAAFCPSSPAAGQETWPQFRGPDSAGVSAAAGLPEAWGPEENVAWKIAVPGRGWSSPIAWKDRVFLTTAVSEGTEEAAKKGLYLGGDRGQPSKNRHRWLVLGYDRETGKQLWEAEAHAGVPVQPRHIKNSHASETPCVDGERIYALFGDIGLFAYDLAGKPLWSKRWEARKVQDGWGPAASPVLADGKVIVVRDNQEKSSIQAFDAKTGEVVWQVDRAEKSNWSTPFIWKTPDRTEIVTTGTGKIRSYGLDGKLLWDLRGTSPITIPTPVAGPGLVYVSSGFVVGPLKPIYAIRPGAAGDISLNDGETANRSIAWCVRDGAAYNPSPLLYGDRLYVLLDRGVLVAYEAKTGKPVFKERLDPAAGAFTASPWAYGGKVFCLSEDGDAFVVDAGPAFRLVRKNAVGEMCMATPAVAGDALFLRTATSLLCIREKAKWARR